MSKTVAPDSNQVIEAYADAAVGVGQSGTQYQHGVLGGEVFQEVLYRLQGAGVSTTLIPESFRIARRRDNQPLPDPASVETDDEYHVRVQDPGGVGWPTLVAIAAELP